MHVEREITVARPRAAVFEHLAHAERLPEYTTGFAWVKQSSEGEPRLGTEYQYKLARGRAGGTFQWTEFEPQSRLAWHGPPLKVLLGSMAPSGSWELSDSDAGTQVRMVSAPEPRGVLRPLTPFISISLRRGNAKALKRLKQLLEQDPAG